MRIARALLALPAVLSLSASATTIPPDLEARAAELRRQASPQVLSWVHDKGVALSRAHGPIDLAALEQSIRSQQPTLPRAPGAQASLAHAGATYPNLGSIGDADIMAVAFLVLMESAKSAEDDLKAIMDGVKLINKQKDALRTIEDTINKENASLATASPAATSTPVPDRVAQRVFAATPTPAPDRVAQLVSAARSIQSKTFGARLAAMAWR